jgi:hypothetical protein
LPIDPAICWIVSIVVSGNYTVFFDSGRVYSSLKYTPYFRPGFSTLSTEYIRKQEGKVQLDGGGKKKPLTGKRFEWERSKPHRFPG